MGPHSSSPWDLPAESTSPSQCWVGAPEWQLPFAASASVGMFLKPLSDLDLHDGDFSKFLDSWCLFYWPEMRGLDEKNTGGVFCPGGAQHSLVCLSSLTL